MYELSDVLEKFKIGKTIVKDKRRQDKELVIGIHLCPIPSTNFSDVINSKIAIETYYRGHRYWTYPECCLIVVENEAGLIER